jgi:hypothetical protein
MFGSALATSIRVAGGLALNPDHGTPNRVRAIGLPAPVRQGADIIIHDREEERMVHLGIHVDLDNMVIIEGEQGDEKFEGFGKD